MKKILCINGSPRGKKATSFALLEYINDYILTSDKEILSLSSFQKTNYETPIKKVMEATDIIIAFPLYVDCIPALLQDFMEKYNDVYRINKKNMEKKLYIIINCGFPETEHTETAMEVMRCFADMSGFKWQLGIGIGMGGMVNPNEIPPTVGIVRPVYNELMKIPSGINNGKINNREEPVSFVTPRINIVGRRLMIKFYNFMGNRGMKQRSGKNGVKQLLKAKPYAADGI